MADMVTEQTARRGEWRAVPTGQLRTTYFLESPAGTELPQCFRVENTPHRKLDTHFHETDQFQVITAGSGTLGRHALAPFSVHFARAYTPYGPIVAGADGLAWLSIRARHDDGAQYMPESRDVLLAVKDRDPWQTTEPVDFEQLPQDARLHPIAGLQDDRGLGAFAVRARPGATVALPDPAATGGQFLIAVRGGVVQSGGDDTHSLATLLVTPQDPAVTVTAGAEGLDALVLNFPRTARTAAASAVSVASAASTASASQAPPGADAAPAATKVWHCEPCGLMYDEAAGLPEEGIAPGTRFEDLPDDWHCPDCSAGKADFVEVDF